MGSNAWMMAGAGLLMVGVMLYLILPMLRGESASFERLEGELTDAQAKRRATLRALRDVEYDFQTGKLDESDYRELKAALSRDALHALARANAEAGAGSGASGVEDADLEAEIARVREGIRDGRACGTCGHVNEDASRFCAMCGSPLSQAAPAK